MDFFSDNGFSLLYSICAELGFIMYFVTSANVLSFFLGQ